MQTPMDKMTWEEPKWINKSSDGTKPAGKKPLGRAQNKMSKLSKKGCAIARWENEFERESNG